MKRKTQVVSIVLLSLFVISIRSTAVVAQQELEWKVKVGGSKTYEVTKYYLDSDSDGDGDKNTHKTTVTDEEGKKVNVTLKEGTIIKVEITELNDDATFQYTYNGNCTTDERIGIIPPQYVMKTVDNKSYWEEYAKTISQSDRDDEHQDIEASVDGSLLVSEVKFRNPNYLPSNVTDESIVKFNWKTGWQIYLYLKVSNDTDTRFEKEIVEKTAGGIPGFEMAPIVLGIFVMTLEITRKRK